MKTKEFIKRVEELGFRVKVCDSQIRILANDFIISVIYIGREYMINTYKPVSIAFRNEDELFDLIIKYAKTPVEDRKEEKKFYLRHRWIKGCVIMYLYRNTLNGYCYLGDKKCRPHRQKMFTLKEIGEIKEKYNTDLSDFEMIEVEEWY